MEPLNSSSSEFLENIATFACNYYNEKLSKQGKPLPEKNEWTTMACIILSENGKNLRVVSGGTGTKCLGQNELSPLGDLLSDSHAEVVARRSFQLFLYDQVESTMSEKSSILKSYKDVDDNLFFELCPEVNVHLFISHVPCGDAAIFDLDVVDSTDKGTEDPPTKKLKIEVHRTGAKLAMRTYEDVQCVGNCRVKPGKGDPTLSMSCSDKIAKWQILGLQGSLLRNIVPKPIVFSSIIIGGSVDFSSKALERAIYHRFHSKLPQDLQQQHQLPTVFQSSTNFMKFPKDGKPAPASISGFLSTSTGKFIAEVSVNGRKQGVTKKNFGTPAARVHICRKNIFQHFVKSTKKYAVLTQSSRFNLSPDSTYEEAKQLNVEYYRVWNYLKEDIMLGWMAKPNNLTCFTATD